MTLYIYEPRDFRFQEYTRFQDFTGDFPQRVRDCTVLQTPRKWSRFKIFSPCYLFPKINFLFYIQQKYIGRVLQEYNQRPAFTKI